MHLALAAPSDSAAFKPEPAEARDWERWANESAELTQRVRDVLTKMGPELDEEARQAVDEFGLRHDEVSQVACRWITPAPVLAKTRHHGDFHLGQVLVQGDDCVVVDFEGEPMRSLAERRAKQVPLRDVAGMLRSFDYAAATLKRELPVSLCARARSEAEARADAWVKEASSIYVDSYLKTVAPAADRPLDESTAKHVIAFFTLQKALYEVLYEVANRPHWICIPLNGALTLLDESTS